MNKPWFLLAIFALMSCNAGRQSYYGTPVFGTVKDECPTVRTVNGDVSGENRDGVAIFRGIPYAQATRFLPPTKPSPWEGVRDCTQNGPIALQEGGSIGNGDNPLSVYFNGGHPEKFGFDEERQDENCLVLNVLTPGIDNAKRPVLVYIHGGGFATGSGALVLGADQWAREEDLVIVGVNHRLNVFGYLYLGALDPAYASSGMAGMLDLVAALEWVRDNIAAFGGNPDCVTIMGESGGGMKVSTLMAMEKARGLFHRAIVESGSNAVGTFSREMAAAQTEQLLIRLGVDKDGWKRLLELPAEKILSASGGLSMTPVADGINLQYSASPEIQAYEISRNIPLMVGSSADEMGVFTPVSQMGITADNLSEKVAEQMHISLEQAQRIVSVFEELNVKGDEPWHTFLKIVSLSGFLGGGAFNQAMAKARQGGAPVYHYFVEYDAELAPGMACAWHTADLPLQMRIVANPKMENLSRLYGHTWAAFIRTGNPSNDALEWPAFSVQDRRVMVFDEPAHVEEDPLLKIREAFQASE